MRLAPFLIAAVLPALSLGAQETLVVKGSQARGVPGRDAKLQSETVNLIRLATLTRVEGGEDGFWIEGGGKTWTFANRTEATGQSFPAGTYRVYPNLGKGKDKASVTVTFVLAPR
ncbi:MAG TPA: hypothetical protein PLC09_00075 [Holophaga sp.]|jgi:hypothetical protein|nr:hypothetical protein [Holophaga sp.]